MAYQLVLYDENYVILRIHKPLENVVVSGNNVTWAGGGSEGIQKNFVVLDESVEIQEGELITQEQIDQDQKANLKSEVEKLRDQLLLTQEAIDFLMGL